MVGLDRVVGSAGATRGSDHRIEEATSTLETCTPSASYLAILKT